MVPTNAKGSKHARFPKGVLAQVGDESAVVDSVSDDESSSLKTTLGKASTSLTRNLDGFGGVGGVLTQSRPTLSSASERKTFSPPAFDGGYANVTMSEHELSMFLRRSILNMCSAKYQGPGGSVSVFLSRTNVVLSQPLMVWLL